MISDLKKFGSQVAKNCKVEHLQTGQGEMVCHLVDELLNVELFRREYQFGIPKFPPDDIQDEQTDELEGEMFGIKISHEVEVKKKRQRLQSGKVEETKINFFDPNVYGEQEAPYEKPAED